MRILQVITSLRIGGAEKLVVDLTSRLKERGYEIDVAVLDGIRTPLMDQLVTSKCKIYKLSANGRMYNPSYIPKLRRIINEYDIVHTHNTAAQFIVAIASIGLKSLLVTTEHNTTNKRRQIALYPKIVDRWMYSRYQRIVCISEKARDNLVSFIGVLSFKSEVLVIHNGIDIKAFSERGNNIRLLFPQSQNRFVVTMVAGFRPQKDQDTAIKAISLLPKGLFELWLVGDGERRKELIDLAERFGVLDYVRFMGIRMDVNDILHSSDAILMSSHYEGLSLSSLEGMSVGKPFIASDVEGLREVVDGAGILYEHQNYSRLADILIKLSGDADFCERVAKNCFTRSIKYDINSMVLSYQQLYCDLLQFSKKSR